MCDVRCPARRVANLDHIVVGRAGIFVIDSRDWSGQLEATPEALLQAGSRRDAPVAGVADAALALAEVLPGLDPQRVVPVLCFDRDEPVSGWVHDVLVCTTDNVVDLLTTQRRVWDAEEADQWFERLKWTLPESTYDVCETNGQPLNGHRRAGKAKTRPARRKSSARRRPPTRTERMTPWVRAALIAVICCLVMLPSIRYGTWPGALS
jgi:hypothetical protein